MSPLTCRDVARAIAVEGGVRADSRGPEAIADHLDTCAPCRTFERQLSLLSDAVRACCDQLSGEAPADLEDRLVRRLCGDAIDPTT